MSTNRTLAQAIGLAIVVLLLVGCGISQSPPTPTPIPPTTTPLPPTPSAPPEPGPITEAKDIVGIWMFQAMFVEYDEDGTVRYAESRLTMREEKLTDVGEFWFEDGQYFQKLTGFYKMGDCQGITGIYEVQLLENGNLRFSVVEDECTQRADLLAIEHEPTMRTGRT